MKSGPTAIPQPGIAYHLADQSVVRRPDQEGQAVVLLHLQVRGQQDLRRRAPTFADGSRAYRQAQGNYSAVTRLT